ncbi:MAG: SDR family oxidoreductase, partial [Bacteroidota bacterium]|nr:SDR family oxidoreductase [Bacteroidota bacterium]
GAKVFLSGRSEDSLNKVANDISASGGNAEIAVVDALDEKLINNFIDTVVSKAGSIDISFNAIGIEDTQGALLADISLEDFIRPIKLAMQTQFLTTRAVSKIMMKQGAGVIMSITASPAGKAYSLVGGFGPACSAIEGFSRNLASELGPFGIRVVNIRSAGSPDSRPFVDALGQETDLSKTFIKKMEDDTMLKKLPPMVEIASVAVFLASDMASAMTGTTANVTCGSTMD